MKTYARIQGGMVAEILSTDGDISQMFHPDLLWVDVTAMSPRPEQNWSAIETSAQWVFAAPPAPPAPTPAQLASEALMAGLTITSTGTPSLNGTYACDALSQSDIIAIETSLNAGKGFPGASTTFNYPDASGVMHSFTATSFTDFAAAVRDFVYGCKSVISGASTALPASTATIA